MAISSNDPDLLPVPDEDFLTPKEADEDDTVDSWELDYPGILEEKVGETGTEYMERKLRERKEQSMSETETPPEQPMPEAPTEEPTPDTAPDETSDEEDNNDDEDDGA